MRMEHVGCRRTALNVTRLDAGMRSALRVGNSKVQDADRLRQVGVGSVKREAVARSGMTWVPHVMQGPVAVHFDFEERSPRKKCVPGLTHTHNLSDMMR